MKKFLLGVFLFFFQFLQGMPYELHEINPLYKDNELTALWESLNDLHHPHVEDFIKIQNYLRYGERPYLDVIFDVCVRSELRNQIDRSLCYYNRILQNVNFVSLNQELPIFEKRIFGGVSAEDKSRCIILYGTFHANKNPLDTDYIKGIFKILDELKQVGYKGHVLYRLGGFPLTDKGSVRFMHIPYAFKLLGFIEASQLGYENVLWIDTSIHPTNDLKEVFAKIQKEGALLLFNGINLDYDFNFIQPILPIAAVQSAGLNGCELRQIPHVIATIIGLSFQHQKTHALIKEWYRLTSLTIPAMTLYPEEFLLSVASWRTHNRPNGDTGEYFDLKSAIPFKPRKAKKPFWFDKG
ncbi:MAG: hypothetical protein ACRDDW_06735 [Candidatus Rhabdochlamydia sp.]